MPEPWRVLRSRLLLDRWPWLRVYGQDVELPNGVVVEDFVRAEMRGFSMVVALTSDQRVVMVEHYRMGVGEVCFEFPAGGLNEGGEDPLAAAQRELLEETGYAAPTWEPLGRYVVDANRGMGAAHLYLARGAERVAEQCLDDTEDIRVHLVDLPTLRAWVREGNLRTLPAAAAAGLALARLGPGATPPANWPVDRPPGSMG